jgi:hypothetical protein
MPRTPLRRPVVWALLVGATVLATAGRSSASPYYSVTELDNEPGGSLNIVYDGQGLNNLGQVAGMWIQNGTGGGDYPYLYDPTAGGQVTLLGLNAPSGLTSGSQSLQGGFTAISDGGQAVGESEQTGNSILYSVGTGQTVNLSIPNGAIISSTGQIYGNVPINNGAYTEPALYTASGNQLLGLPPGAVSAQVTAVNAQGPPNL